MKKEEEEEDNSPLLSKNTKYRKALRTELYAMENFNRRP